METGTTTSTTTYFPGRVQDFERAPWLPCLDLAQARDREANWCADYVEHGCLELAADKARAVRLMRDEDLRLGEAFRAAYREWKTSVAA